MGQRVVLAARLRDAVDWLYDFATTERQAWILYGAVVLVVAIFAFVVLGWGYISGTGAYWQQPLYDAGAHVSGWLFFGHDSWHFPIFDTARMNYPDGGSIILTDSIPLVAFVAKLLGLGLFLGSWHYFGLFVAGSYVLNAVALLWLLRQMGVKNIAAALVAVTFACFTTLYDIQFESFFAQFVVIMSFGLYVRLRRHFATKELGLFAALVAASLLIHPYLFAMSLGIFGVTLLTLWRQGKISLHSFALWLGGTAVLLGTLAFISGYTAHPATGYQEHLYGTSSAFALDPTALFHKSYSVDEIGLYLGMGFWILTIAGLVKLWQRRAILKAHLWLVALCVLFVLIAISNTLFVNSHQIFQLNLPQAIASMAEMFRASKRFVVPVYYLTIVVAVVLLLRQKSRWGLAIVLVALLLQVADTSFFVRGLHQSAREGQAVVLDQAEWGKAMGRARIVQIFPSYSCMFNYRSAPLSGQWTASLELYQIAAKEGAVSNSVRASRRTKDCGQEAKQSHQNPAHGGLNVYLADDAKRFILQPSQACIDQKHMFQYGIYCTGP